MRVNNARDLPNTDSGAAAPEDVDSQITSCHASLGYEVAGGQYWILTHFQPAFFFKSTFSAFCFNGPRTIISTHYRPHTLVGFVGMGGKRAFTQVLGDVPLPEMAVPCHV